MRRRTKIICTIGPASNDFDTLNAMYEAGMNVARINMSHATHEDAARTIGWIKTLNRKTKYPVPVLIDTQGPEIRTAKRDHPLVLRKGTEVVLIPELSDYHGPVTSRLEVQFEGLKGAVSAGDTIVLDNGLINLKVSNQNPAAIRCMVLDDGVIGSRKHINIPGVHINLPSITSKDRDDVKFGLELDVDFIAQSFVRSHDDVAKMRELLNHRNHGIQVVAKIENREGATNIESIAETADGLMV
ncbi:MAG: pyruvate kinase, partial [Pseudomonadota bacterium]|nr:pyruvate kinase [Pseudomonadota bacterium]